MKKAILSRLIPSCALLVLVLTLFSCKNGTSSDPKEDLADTTPTTEEPVVQTPAAAPAALVKGIYSGTYDGKTATFICSGSDCVIAVDGKTYAKGTFTDLSAASASARAAGFAANLTITEKVNSSGILCAVAAPEKITFAFPPEGSTEPITITANGVTSTVTREVTYIVTFDHQNNQYSELPVKAGTALKLDDPLYNSFSKGNYSLMEWCLDKECTQPAPNPLTVDKNMTLYAKWAMTTLAAPTVSNVSDGISIPVDFMPDETNGFQLFRVNADGSWTSIYYRGSGEKDYKTNPILYPFVEAGKAYRFVIQFYGSDSLTKAVSEQFSVTPTNGVGEISVSNGGDVSFNITDDGKFSIKAAPTITGTGAAAIKDQFCHFEFWKGNGWASEAFTYVNSLFTTTTDTTVERDLYRYLLTNSTVPMPSGSKFFVHLVVNVKYGNDSGYRVFDTTSDVNTLTYDARWRPFLSIYGDPSSCVFTIEKTATGSTIAVTSDPNDEGVSLMYICEEARNKSCTFSVTVRNTSAVAEEAQIAVRGLSAIAQDSKIPLPAGETTTITINSTEKVVTVNPMLYLTVTGGSFEVSNPTVTENM